MKAPLTKQKDFASCILERGSFIGEEAYFYKEYKYTVKCRTQMAYLIHVSIQDISEFLPN